MKFEFRWQQVTLEWLKFSDAECSHGMRLTALLTYSDSDNFFVFTISSSMRAPYSMDSS